MTSYIRGEDSFYIEASKRMTHLLLAEKSHEETREYDMGLLIRNRLFGPISYHTQREPQDPSLDNRRTGRSHQTQS